MLGGRGFDHGFRLPEVSFDGFAETGDLLPSTSSNNNNNNNKQASERRTDGMDGDFRKQVVKEQ